MFPSVFILKFIMVKVILTKTFSAYMKRISYRVHSDRPQCHASTAAFLYFKLLSCCKGKPWPVGTVYA